jgi:hypothetical protein
MGVKRAIVGLTTAALVLLFVVPTALAQNSTSQAGYGGEAAVQVSLSESSTAAASQSQSLPLTGLDLGLLVVGGALLVIVGLGMRRLARERK